MRCVERTLDLIDGFTLVSLLRSRALEAHLFDENFVRQDWFKILVFGGFRVMVPEAQLEQARDLVRTYRRGGLALDHADVDYPSCPRGDGGSGEVDARARQGFWIALIMLGALEFLCIMLPGAIQALMGLAVLWTAFVLLVLLNRRLLAGRYRCRVCKRAWTAGRDEPFAAQQQRAEQAS